MNSVVKEKAFIKKTISVVPTQESKGFISLYPVGSKEFAQACLELNNLFCSQEWLGFLQEQNGFEFYWLQNNEGEGLFIALFQNLTGNRLVSLPFCDYSQTSIRSGASFHHFYSFIRQQWPEHIITLKLLNQEGRFNELRNMAVGKAFRHEVPLESAAQVEANYHKSFSRAVQKGRREGIQVRMNHTASGAQNYYHLHRSLRLQKFMSLPQPFSFFEGIYNTFICNDKGFFLEALHHDKVIGSLLVLKHQQKLFYKFGASAQGSLALRPNNLLFDSLFQYGLANGFQLVDLGISKDNKASQGLIRFKDNMGGHKEEVLFLEHIPEMVAEPYWGAKKHLKDLTGQLVKDAAHIDVDAYSQQLYVNFA